MKSFFKKGIAILLLIGTVACTAKIMFMVRDPGLPGGDGCFKIQLIKK